MTKEKTKQIDKDLATNKDHTIKINNGIVKSINIGYTSTSDDLHNQSISFKPMNVNNTNNETTKSIATENIQFFDKTTKADTSVKNDIFISKKALDRKILQAIAIGDYSKDKEITIVDVITKFYDLIGVSDSIDTVINYLNCISISYYINYSLDFNRCVIENYSRVMFDKIYASYLRDRVLIDKLLEIKQPYNICITKTKDKIQNNKDSKKLIINIVLEGNDLEDFLILINKKLLNTDKNMHEIAKILNERFEDIGASVKNTIVCFKEKYKYIEGIANKEEKIETLKEWIYAYIQKLKPNFVIIDYLTKEEKFAKIEQRNLILLRIFKNFKDLKKLDPSSLPPTKISIIINEKNEVENINLSIINAKIPLTNSNYIVTPQMLRKYNKIIGNHVLCRPVDGFTQILKTMKKKKNKITFPANLFGESSIDIDEIYTKSSRIKKCTFFEMAKKTDMVMFNNFMKFLEEVYLIANVLEKYNIDGIKFLKKIYKHSKTMLDLHKTQKQLSKILKNNYDPLSIIILKRNEIILLADLRTKESNYERKMNNFDKNKNMREIILRVDSLKNLIKNMKNHNVKFDLDSIVINLLFTHKYADFNLNLFEILDNLGRSKLNLLFKEREVFYNKNKTAPVDVLLKYDINKYYVDVKKFMLFKENKIPSHVKIIKETKKLFKKNIKKEKKISLDAENNEQQMAYNTNEDLSPQRIGRQLNSIEMPDTYIGILEQHHEVAGNEECKYGIQIPGIRRIVYGLSGALMFVGLITFFVVNKKKTNTNIIKIPNTLKSNSSKDVDNSKKFY